MIGGSVGGHQALEWAIMDPDKFDKLCLVASSAVISPWAAAFNQSQRMAIEVDPTWKLSHKDAGSEGMKVARSMALLSYRNYGTYQQSQQEKTNDALYQTKAASYQAYQGLKLSRRFNAFSYWHIAKAMDSQNIGRNRGEPSEILSTIKAKTLIISIENDLIFTLNEQEFLAEYIPHAIHRMISSDYGHDGFLLETEKISRVLREFFV